jgi:hypothetical protein
VCRCERSIADISAGTADVRQVFEQAKNGLKLTGRYDDLLLHHWKMADWQYDHLDD